MRILNMPNVAMVTGALAMAIAAPAYSKDRRDNARVSAKADVQVRGEQRGKAQQRRAQARVAAKAEARADRRQNARASARTERRAAETARARTQARAASRAEARQQAKARAAAAARTEARQQARASARVQARAEARQQERARTAARARIEARQQADVRAAARARAEARQRSRAAAARRDAVAIRRDRADDRRAIVQRQQRVNARVEARRDAQIRQSRIARARISAERRAFLKARQRAELRDARAYRQAVRNERRRDYRQAAQWNPRLVRANAWLDGCPPGLQRKHNGCMPPGLARQQRAYQRATAFNYYRPDVLPYRYRDYYDAGYRYDDGYIYRMRDNRIASYLPVLGGALSVGSLYPANYVNYAMPDYYRAYYGRNDDYLYRYADRAVFALDPETQAIQAIAALLTGADWTIGQPMPAGYGVYNVPSAYRSRYYDTADSLYRYNDGYVYQVDPRTRLVSSAIPLLGAGGYAPAYATPYGGSYYPVGGALPASYGAYNVPLGYRSLYYDTPDTLYRYNDAGYVYRVDPETRAIQAIAALATGDDWAVGQPVPAGYGAYNVPLAYRDRYVDSPTAQYRYSDGYVYRVDPKTQLVAAAIQLLV